MLAVCRSQLLKEAVKFTGSLEDQWLEKIVYYGCGTCDMHAYTPRLKKVYHFIFTITSAKVGVVFIFFTVKFRKDLQEA